MQNAYFFQEVEYIKIIVCSHTRKIQLTKNTTGVNGFNL